MRTYLISVLTVAILPVATHFCLAHDLELLTLAWVLQDAIFVGKEVGLVMVIGCRLGPAKVIILVLAEYKLTVFRTFSDSVILIVIVSCFNHR